jgi:hypothetical protein
MEKLIGMLLLIPGILTLMAIVCFVLSLPGTWLWNLLMPYLFELPRLWVWEFFGLACLGGCLTSGMRLTKSKK